ncbi:MAG: hypothetical protein A2036_00895 [Omnitrophica bacterium GWA2_50_21]|nr:MAG: hypothetical protein A2036_00895 [Omnitrophica bacterium GWA2_50_21]
MKTTLSAQESKLILKLAWEKKRLVKLDEIVRILKVSRDHAYKIASVLCDKRWLERLKSGSYQIIPLEGGPRRVSEMNPYVIGQLLDEPYFFSYATANTHYGFSSQVYTTLFVALKKQRRMLSLKGVDIQFVSLSASKFFGFGEVEVMGERVQMAEPEKALLDSLDKPQYAGGIEEVCAIFDRAKGKIDPGKLTDYAFRFETTSLIQRLGFLIDFIKLPIPKEIRNRLLNKVKEKAQPIPLAVAARFGRKGKSSTDWLIIQNVPQNLMRNH